MGMDRSKKVSSKGRRAKNSSGNSTVPGRTSGGNKVQSTKSNRKNLPKR